MKAKVDVKVKFPAFFLMNIVVNAIVLFYRAIWNWQALVNIFQRTNCLHLNDSRNFVWKEYSLGLLILNWTQNHVISLTKTTHRTLTIKSLQLLADILSSRPSVLRRIHVTTYVKMPLKKVIPDLKVKETEYMKIDKEKQRWLQTTENYWKAICLWTGSFPASFTQYFLTKAYGYFRIF